MSSEPDTKARILDAAQACAAQKNALTMAEVAVRARLSRQAVYLHFPDRAALLAGLAARLDQPDAPAIAAAPSARAALTALVARLAQIYPKAWPVARVLEGELADTNLTSVCHALAMRFRDEGALGAHLSPATAQDLLCTLLSLAVWKELVVGRGWDSARYRSHIAFLAAGALTR
jgi:AcrR family transcriptional regulator